MKRTRSLLCLAQAVTLGAFLTAASPADAQETVIYKETFPFCSYPEGAVVNGTLNAEQTSWAAFKTGLRVGRFGNLKVFSFGNKDVSDPVNSNPTGFSQGYAFWSKDIDDGLTIFTREFQFDVSVLSSITFNQRMSSVDPANGPKTRLALLVSGTWYISDQTFPEQTNGLNWDQSVTVQPFDLTYGTAAGTEFGPEKPTNSGVDLPVSGTVEAFGIFLPPFTQSRVRIDNFVIRAVLPAGSTIPTAVQQPTTASCPATSPDVTTGATPTPNPSPTDDEDDPLPTATPTPIGTGVTEGTPTPTQPVPTATPTRTPTSVATATATPRPTSPAVSYVFCAPTEVGSGPLVVISRKGSKALLKVPKNPGISDYRDLALLAILSARKLPVGSLINVKLGDYNAPAGTLTVVTKAGKAPTVVRLSAKAKAELERYIAQVLPGAPADAPLFVAKVTGAGTLTAQNAMCVAELRQTIRQLAKKAKVAKEVQFVKPTKPKKRK